MAAIRRKEHGKRRCRSAATLSADRHCIFYGVRLAMWNGNLVVMKHKMLCSVALASLLLTGCQHDPAPTNGGLSTAGTATLEQKSANGKAETGSVMRMDASNVPPMLAKKMFHK